MLQDVEASKPLEIDALVGAVRELGQITSTPRPTPMPCWGWCG